MFTSGQSWRMAESASQALTIAVYVREIHALPVPDFDGAPPALRDVPDTLLHILDDSERTTAGAQWPSWWADLIELETRSNADGLTREQRRELLARRQALVDPSDLSALDDRLELRTAVAAAFEDAVRWTNGRDRPDTGPDGVAHGDWPHISEVVDQVAFDRGVDPGALSATMLTVDVEGPWWQVVGPGVCVCSTDFAADRRTATAARYTTFASALN